MRTQTKEMKPFSFRPPNKLTACGMTREPNRPSLTGLLVENSRHGDLVGGLMTRLNLVAFGIKRFLIGSVWLEFKLKLK